MKRLTTLLAVTLLALTSQAQAQLKGGGEDTIIAPSTNQLLPAVQKARETAYSAYYRCSDAYYAAKSGKNKYWQASASLQYQAWSNVYEACVILYFAEQDKSITDQDYLSLVELTLEAENLAYRAANYARMASKVDGSVSSSSGYQLAVASWNKVELLVEEVDYVGFMLWPAL